jgi:hypothetical protein
VESVDDLSPAPLPAPKYLRTPEEAAVAETIFARRKNRPPSPKLAVTQKAGSVSVGHDHPDKSIGWMLMVNALGTTDYEFADGLLTQLMNVGTQGQNYDGKWPNFMLSIINGIAPKDEVEAMMAAQMAAVHMATMTFARRLAHVDNLAQQDSAERAFNKLARTFAVQMEALKRYRTGGEQKVTVHHVTVNEGGQAIVGAVSQSPTRTGGGGNSGGVPMKGTMAMHPSPRGPATSKRTQVPCQAPADTGWTVCRFHGAMGGGPKGERNGAYRHGLHTAEAVADRRAVAELVRRARQSLS